MRIHAFLEEAKGILYLDTSGEALFKRGWRMDIAEAPIRENLAAGIIMLTGWKFDQPLLDPMCGGGTLLSEAAAMARGRAPGAKRSFGFEKLSVFDAKLWEKDRGTKGTLQPVEPRLYGSDTDPEALQAARRNFGAAGVERWVKLEQSRCARAGRTPAGSGVMVANPPYGERIGSADELPARYPKLGDALKKNSRAGTAFSSPPTCAWRS